MFVRFGRVFLSGLSSASLLASVQAPRAQTQLPAIVVAAPPVAKPKPKPKPKVAGPVASRVAKAAAPVRSVTPSPRRGRPVVAAPLTVAGPGNGAPASEEARATEVKAAFDAARGNIPPKSGINSFSIDRSAIQALPQGDNAPLTKALLQAPGVAQDSAASGDLHIRNEHANVQYRVNGVLLPEGVQGFSQVLGTSFIGGVTLLTGALPAQYGLHTSGVVDITTRVGGAPGGGVGIYGGSHQTAETTVDYGGAVGKWDFFFTARLGANSLGIENPAPSAEATHDFTRQGQFFGYASTLLDDSTRLSFITGTSINAFKIPNAPGAAPGFTAFGVGGFDSSLLNESQLERSFYNVVAVQKKLGDFDGQLAFFSRYSALDFYPDTLGDLVFNGVASRVSRESLVNGLQGDGAYRLNDAHTLRAGFTAFSESTRSAGFSTVLPLDAMGNPVDAPYGVLDASSKTGWTFGAYVQDEWRLSDRLTVNAGLRFDQIYQYVDANQLSPRLNASYRLGEDTTVHAGYARYFTPPPQALAAPANLALVANSTQAPEVALASPALPERSDYFDAGITRKFTPKLEVGVDVYLKKAQDLLDDGQFGSALVLTAFNYAKAENRGVELKAAYEDGGLRVYGNIALAKQTATRIVSNQYLFGQDELDYIASHYVFTDHAQLVTGSAGVSYQWDKTRVGADLIYGGGLRDGFANTGTVPAYTQVNLGLSREFTLPGFSKPATLRFDILNLFDSVYEIRDGSGIGVFAPQYGPRRGFFAGLTQRF